MATQAELDAFEAQAVILAPASSARNVIQPTAGTVIAAIVRAHAAQSVDLLQWQLSDATVLAKIGPTGCWTIQPSSLGLTGAVLIDAGTPPLVGPNDPQRAALNLKATASAATDGETYGVRFGSYRDSNFDHAILGKYDWLFDSFETGGDTFPYLTMYARDAANRKALVSSTFGYNVSGATYPAGDGVAVGYYALGGEFGGTGKTGGLKLWDFDDFLIHETLAGGVAKFAFQRAGGVWKWGIGAMAPTPGAVDQVASTIPDLWVVLKSHGVLGAASSAPTVYTPGGTDVAVADGGTGSSTAAGARTNLGTDTYAIAMAVAL